MIALAAVSGAALAQTTAPVLKFYKLQPSQITQAAANAIATKQGFRFVPDTTGANGGGGVFYNGQERIVGYLADGSVRFMPDLDNAPQFGPAPTLAVAQAALNKFLGTARGLLPGDGAVSSQGDSSLWGASSGSPNVDTGGTINETKPVDYFRSARLMRLYDKLPRFGPKSIIGGVVDGRGNMAGFTDTFAPVLADGSVTPIPKTDYQVTEEANLRIRMMSQGGSYKIVKRTLAYYEQGLTWMQPVYLYDVLFTQPNFTRQAETIIIPAAVNSPEPIVQNMRLGEEPIIPVNTQPTGKLARTATESDQLWATLAPAAAQANPLIVGQYVVREDADGWLNDAKAFWATLNLGRAFSSLWASRPGIVRRDYYWDYRRLWENETGYGDWSPWFVNQDHLVQIQGHGAPWIITCYKDYGEIIHLNQIAGYGGNRAGGKTAYCIWQSCDVIPEPGHPFEWDFTAGHSAFDVWWGVFKGMHANMGYRTLMHIYNGVGGPYGFALGNGCPVAASWLSCTDHAVFNHSNGWDYGNVVYVTGRGGDTVYDNAPLPNPGSLTMWWIHA